MKDLSWKQDVQTLTLEFKIPRTSRKKIFVTLGDLFVKVTCPEKGIAHIVDLSKEIEFDSPQNSISYSSNILKIYLIKKSKGIWISYEVGNMSKADKRKRRMDSIKRLDDHERQKHEKLKKTKAELNRVMTDERIKIMDNKRQEIDAKKAAIQDRAIQEIYGESGKREGPAVAKVKAIESRGVKEDNVMEWEDKGQEEVQEQEEAEVKEKRQPRPIPGVRNAQNTTAKLEFTEKLFPKLAARESHFQHAPLPRIKRHLKKQGIKGDFKNPLWMKDKGDEFFKTGDFESAINAYSSALQLDNNMLPSLSNRSICYLKIFSIEECIKDCDMIVELYSKLNEDEKLFTGNLRVFEKAQLRKLLCMAYKGKFEACKENMEKFREGYDLRLGIFEDPKVKEGEVEEEGGEKVRTLEEKKALVMSENRNTVDKRLCVYQIVKSDLERLEKRENILKEKAKGDESYKKNEVSRALEIYQKLLEEEPGNERVLSNIAICYYKLKNYESSIDYCSKSLEKIEKFFVKKSNKDTQLLELYTKNLLRRANCYAKFRDKREMALSDIKKILILQEENKAARRLRKEVQRELDYEASLELKEKGDQSLKTKKLQEALELYDSALKGLNSLEFPVDFLGILLNKMVAYLGLGKYEEIVSCGVSGLKLVDRIGGEMISVRRRKLDEDDKKKISKYEVLLSMRRGNAYLKLGQLYHAKADFERVLKLEPDNKVVKKTLEKINA